MIQSSSSYRDSSAGSTEKVATQAYYRRCCHVISPPCHTSSYTTKELSDTTTRLWRVYDDDDDGAAQTAARKFTTSCSRRVVRRKLFVLLSLPSYYSFITLMMLSIVILDQSPRAYASLASTSSPASSIIINSTTTVRSTLALSTSTSTVSSVNRKSKGSLLNYLKGQKPISIPENRVITTEDTEDYLEEDSAEIDYEELLKKENASGLLVGSRCEFTCDKRLNHVYCNPNTDRCECEKKYPVKIGPRKGCAKPKRLDEQCFYDEVCQFHDENSRCVQIDHNAICQCAEGYHQVSHSKPTRRVFCVQDLTVNAQDLPTLLGVASGIFVLAGLICMVLHLFSKTRYPPARSFGDTHHGPPTMYSSDTGIPLTIQSNRPSSRSSQRSNGSISSISRRHSKGVSVSQSRQGSRRPSVASVHSTTSSIRSYSSRRFEQELKEKELRQEMKQQLCRLQEQQQMQKLRPTIIIGDTSIPFTVSKFTNQMPSTPHILTPNSTDELLPCVEENEEFSPQFDRKNQP